MCQGTQGHLVVNGNGAGNYGMWTSLWPTPLPVANARTSVMGGEQAANVLATVQRDNIEAKGGSWSADEEAKFNSLFSTSTIRSRMHTSPRVSGTMESSTRRTPGRC